MKKTTIALHKEDAAHKWYLVDATDIPLGRLAVKLANLLRGKGKPLFTPHVDCGDYVVVINAEKVKLTGKKDFQKKYYSHSGYTGALKITSVSKVRTEAPEKLIMEAVRRMMAHNRLSRKVLKKLKIYRGPEYQEKAQKPEPLVLS